MIELPLPFRVQVKPGEDWIDITGDVRKSEAIEIVNGRRDEGERADPTAIKGIKLNNRHGKYSPRNPLSPYYGQLTADTPLRVLVDFPPLNANPFFETDVTDWSGLNGASVDHSTAQAHEGSGAMLITPDGSTADPQAQSEAIAVAAGHILSVGSWLRSPGTPTVGVAIRWFSDAAGTAFLADTEDLGPVAADTWTFRARTGVAPQTALSARLVVKYSGTPSAGTTLFADETILKLATSVRGIGHVAEWPPRWDMSGNDSWVPIEVAGETRRHQDRGRVLDSAIRRFVPRSTEFVAAYWPMEDTGGRFFAPGLPAAHHAMRTVGPIDLASVDKPGSKPLPLIKTGASITARIPHFEPVDESYRVDWFFRIPDQPATERHMLDLHTTSPEAARFIPRVGPSNFSVRVIDQDGATIHTFTEARDERVVGNWLQCLLRVAMFGSSISYNIRVWLIDTDDLGRELLHTADNFIGGTGQTLGRPWAIMMHKFQQDRSLGHIIVSRSGDFIDADPLPFLAFNGFATETAGNRLVRLALEENVPITFFGSELEDTEPLGPQPVAKFLDIVEDAAKVDAGIFGEYGDSLPGLAYRTRKSMYRQAVKLTLSEGQLADAPEPTDDDQRLVDQVRARRPNGGQVTVGAAEPRRDVEVELNAASDERLRQLAAWRLSRGQVDEMRWPRLSFSLVAHPELAADWLAFRLGDRVVYEHSKAQLPGVTVDQLGEGWVERISESTWNVTLVCAPASPFSPAVFGADRFDTEDSELAASFEAGTDTSMSVETEGPLWTTDSGELPLDVFAAGVVLRVTAISGSSSPQTFTVQQTPVNGVAKTIPAGAKVHLHPRSRFGL